MLHKRAITYLEILISVGQQRGNLVRLQGSTTEVDLLIDSLGGSFSSFIVQQVALHIDFK
jgi:hypothetical protein